MDPSLLDDQRSGRLIASIEIDLSSPRRSYILSDAFVTASQQSTTPQGEAIETVTLTFDSLTVPSGPAVANAASTWVTVCSIGSFPVDSARLQATVSAPNGTWVFGLDRSYARNLPIASAELELQSPARTYTLSNALVSSVATSPAAQGRVSTTTFTLLFTDASEQIPFAPPVVFRQ